MKKAFHAVVRLAHQVYFWATIVRRVNTLNRRARRWQPAGGRAIFIQGLLADLNYGYRVDQDETPHDL